jgi:hypothetical protein
MNLRADHIGGAFFVACGLLVIALSTDLPFGQLSMPGAGFLPEIVAVLIIVLGGSLFFRANESPSFAEIEWDDARHALQVIATACAAASLYIYLGFIITMFAMMLVLLVAIERKNILRAAVYSAGVAVVTYIVFVHVLQSPLPPGILGYW